MQNGKEVLVGHAYAVEWHIEVEAFPIPLANVIIVTLPKIGPEAAMLIAVDGEVQHSVREEHRISLFRIHYYHGHHHNPLFILILLQKPLSTATDSDGKF